MNSEELKKREIELKKLEVDLNKKKQDQDIKQKKKFPIESTIVVALIAFAGSFVASIIDGQNKRRQQQQEFESTLIINAVNSVSSDVNKNNLKFLIDVNLINDKAKEIKLTKIIKDSTYQVSKLTTNSTVYICSDSTATKYHLSKNCRALSRCNKEILGVTISEAESKYHRSICGFEN